MSRPSPAGSLVLSLLLHALAFAAIVTGVASPAGANRHAAALLRSPETVNVQFVETADAPPAKPLEPTKLVSERDMRAADGAPRELAPGEPFNRGVTSLPSVTAGDGRPGEASRPEAVSAGRSSAESPPRPAAREGARGRTAKEQPSAEERGSADSRAAPTADVGERPAAAEGAVQTAPSSARAFALGDRRLEMPRLEVPLPPLAGTGGAGRRGLPQVDNRLTRARYEGDFSLSTYAWDYAPYMRRLKRQIEDYTWTILPSAFWYGIAAWATQVRFIILPDGRLQSVVIKGHEGVLDLRHVAPDAVHGAANFEPLPPGFPEPELVVTGNFYFNVFPPGGAAGEDREDR